MKCIFKSLLVFLLFSCNNGKLDKPVLLSQADTISTQSLNLKFKTQHKNWKAILFTFNQPIELNTSFRDSTLQVNYSSKKLNLNSAANLCLIANDNCFNYNFFLKNSASVKEIQKDYRSPKTVNSDSSLQHDRVSYLLDEAQNLVAINNKIFNQEQFGLQPQVLTKNAIDNNNLSAFYVQAGSLQSIEIKSIIDSAKNAYVISTNVMKDRYNNIIANGTKICFEGLLNNGVSKIYATTVDGKVFIRLPISIYKGTVLTAYSQKIYSNKLTLK